MSGFDSERRRRRMEAEVRKGSKRRDRKWRVFKLTKERRRIERLLAAQEVTV